jgi:hypothetical protein
MWTPIKTLSNAWIRSPQLRLSLGRTFRLPCEGTESQPILGSANGLGKAHHVELGYDVIIRRSLWLSPMHQSEFNLASDCVASPKDERQIYA